MRAGSLRHRLEFQTFTGTDDGHGNEPGAWVLFVKLWGSLREGDGREVIEAGRLEASKLGQVRVRYSQLALTITEAHRMKDHRGRIWNIIRIGDPIDKKEFLDMTVELGVAV